MNGGFGLMFERHFGGFWGSCPFATVTRGAGGYDVFPGVGPPQRSGNDVIEGEIFATAAVLTTVTIPAKDFSTVDGGDFPDPL